MKIAKTTLHNEALARIRDMVTEGQLEPGSKISELKLCELFGISRTPVREALKVLANEGMLVLLPNRGARVAQVSAKDLADLFRVVGTLEGLAGELACANIRDEALNEIRALHHEMLAHHARGDRAAYFRLNQAIHDAIFAAAGNGALSAMYERLRGRIRPARFMANVTRERWDEAVREHGQILDALMRRDGPRLREILKLHLEHKYLALAAVSAAAEKSSSARGDDDRPEPAKQLG
jgi:DNA-binding GntR family transcriptional regulator